ncbi:hypothetical protein I7I53_10559 [Histoplasma capsulatum var. duboisii H88]|uniref:Uncharacterized protein n=1 Tax=Ajellomyces capsulatus (strain H88) TaxID=544711 RepID=A0A8A1LC34_AJEC8|nr:hypothetical protein I7I53_10559 [Histoplasma capsulatum var. duboisii H88]
MRWKAGVPKPLQRSHIPILKMPYHQKMAASLPQGRRYSQAQTRNFASMFQKSECGLLSLGTSSTIRGFLP